MHWVLLLCWAAELQLPMPPRPVHQHPSTTHPSYYSYYYVYFKANPKAGRRHARTGTSKSPKPHFSFLTNAGGGEREIARLTGRGPWRRHSSTCHPPPTTKVRDPTSPSIPPSLRSCSCHPWICISDARLSRFIYLCVCAPLPTCSFRRRRSSQGRAGGQPRPHQRYPNHPAISPPSLFVTASIDWSLVAPCMLLCVRIAATLVPLFFGINYAMFE